MSCDPTEHRPQVFWRLSYEPQCTRCGKLATPEQILIFCTKALADGIERWRYDEIPEAIIVGMDIAKNKKVIDNTTRSINIVRGICSMNSPTG